MKHLLDSAEKYRRSVVFLKFVSLLLVVAGVRTCPAQQVGASSGPGEVMAAVVGAPGTTQYCYWVIVHSANGQGTLPAACIANAPERLSRSDYVAISWPAVSGALWYDVIRTASARFPAGGGCMACTVILGTTDRSARDWRGGIGPYAIAGNAKGPGGTLNAKDFGAKGNGVADDTGAIQAAIDRTAAGPGGTVYLPPGTYRIASGPLRITANRRLVLSGEGATLYPASGLAALYISVSPANNAGVQVNGLRFWGNGDRSTTGAVINDHFNAVLEHVRFESLGTGLEIRATGYWSEQNDLHEAYFNDCGTGIYFNRRGPGPASLGYSFWDNVHIDNVHPGGTGLYIGPNSSLSGIHWENLTIHGPQTGHRVTLLRIDGQILGASRIGGILEGFGSDVTAVALGEHSDVYACDFELSFLGTLAAYVRGRGTGFHMNIGAGQVRTSEGSKALRAAYVGDRYDRFSVAGSTIRVGTGSGAEDAGFDRAAPGVIRVTDGGSGYGAIALRNTTPGSSRDACVPRSLWADSDYIYVCTASGRIKRSALSDF